MPTDPRRELHHSWWQALVRGREREPDRLVLVSSARHPDGARVELDAAALRRQAGVHVVCEAILGPADVTGLRVGPHVAPKAPPVWFLEVPEPDRSPPATNLLAFATGGPTAGSLVGREQASGLPLTRADQLGAIRWYPATGEVDQVYVGPAQRRQHLGSALITAAATLSVARDWPRLWGDGHRTALGEDLRNARSWRDRAADLTHLAPPMTPPDPS